LSWVYTFEWPLFGAYAVFMWWSSSTTCPAPGPSTTPAVRRCRRRRPGGGPGGRRRGAGGLQTGTSTSSTPAGGASGGDRSRAEVAEKFTRQASCATGAASAYLETCSSWGGTPTFWAPHAGTPCVAARPSRPARNDRVPPGLPSRCGRAARRRPASGFLAGRGWSLVPAGQQGRSGGAVEGSVPAVLAPAPQRTTSDRDLEPGRALADEYLDGVRPTSIPLGRHHSTGGALHVSDRRVRISERSGSCPAVCSTRAGHEGSPTSSSRPIRTVPPIVPTATPAPKRPTLSGRVHPGSRLPPKKSRSRLRRRSRPRPPALEVAGVPPRHLQALGPSEVELDVEVDGESMPPKTCWDGRDVR